MVQIKQLILKKNEVKATLIEDWSTLTHLLSVSRDFSNMN